MLFPCVCVGLYVCIVLWVYECLTFVCLWVCVVDDGMRLCVFLFLLSVMVSVCVCECFLGGGETFDLVCRALRATVCRFQLTH